MKWQQLEVVGNFLRVPAWFVLEKWCQFDIKLYVGMYEENSGESGLELHIILSTIGLIAVAIALFILLLPLEKLIQFYKHVVAVILILLSHWTSQTFLTRHSHLSDSNIKSDGMLILGSGISVYLLVHIFTSSLLSYILSLSGLLHRALACIYILPIGLHIFGFSSEHQMQAHVIAQIIMLLASCWYLSGVAPQNWDEFVIFCHSSYIHCKERPVSALINVFQAVYEPTQLLLFWLSLFFVHFCLYLQMDGIIDRLFTSTWYFVFIALIASCCATPISLVALCITVSYLKLSLLFLTRMFLHGSLDRRLLIEPLGHRRWTEAVTFMLLAIQTRLLEIKSVYRALLLGVMFFILLSSIMQSMFEIVDPLLLSLSASQQKRIWSHLRALALATFLLINPILLVYVMCQFFNTTDFWLLVIISSCLLTTVQMLGSLIIYILFMYDSHSKKPVWGGLDDAVYVCKVCVRSLEFAIAFCVLVFGFRQMLEADEFSYINSSILIIHCYCNIWLRLQAGWHSFLLRRSASVKINSLSRADQDQVEEHNDVCAICYQLMEYCGDGPGRARSEVVVTHCRHLYHANCLRKWLYCEEFCPLCHSSVTAQTPPMGEEEADEHYEGAEPWVNDINNADINQNGLRDENLNEVWDQNEVLRNRRHRPADVQG